MKEIGEIKKKIKPTDPETSQQSKKKNHQQSITKKKKKSKLWKVEEGERKKYLIVRDLSEKGGEEREREGVVSERTVLVAINPWKLW